MRYGIIGLCILTASIIIVTYSVLACTLGCTSTDDGVRMIFYLMLPAGFGAAVYGAGILAMGFMGGKRQAEVLCAISVIFLGLGIFYHVLPGGSSYYYDWEEIFHSSGFKYIWLINSILSAGAGLLFSSDGRRRAGRTGRRTNVFKKRAIWWLCMSLIVIGALALFVFWLLESFSMQGIWFL